MENIEALQTMRQLNDKERRQAHDAARDVVAGPVPKPEDFDRLEISDYPGWMQGLIVALAGVLLVAAFLTSAIRIYDVGYDVAFDSIGHGASSLVIGGSMVLLAEIGMVIFSLAFAVLPGSKASNRILIASALVATVIALSGNITAAQPPAFGDARFLVSWLEAVAPPALVLGTAYVLKEQMLTAIHERSKRTALYKQALVDRNRILEEPESASGWSMRYFEALRDRIYRANARGKTKALRNSLSTANWIALVKRELDKEAQLQALYAGIVASGQESAPPKRSKSAASNGRKALPQNGHTPAQSATPNIEAFQRGDKWVAVCPYPECGREFEAEEEFRALQSCRGHQKAHAGETLPILAN